MISRPHHLQTVQSLLRRFPVAALLGARQVGKTTLARQLASAWRGPVTWFDLENPEDESLLTEPFLHLNRLRGLVVLDEVQRLPDLFKTLRVLADRPRRPARFLVLGSASPDLLRQSSESLAGRIAYHSLPGLTLREVGTSRLERLWVRGGFPRSYLARTDKEADGWRREFIRTFLERDLPQLGLRMPSASLRRFWTMLAHYHGQVWNGSELARSFGVADTTVRKYVDILSSTFLVRQLLPWHANVGKRQIKSPKIYFADSGLLHTLLGVPTLGELSNHPKVGASWEGFSLETVAQCLGADPEECFFWGTHAGAELDLLVVRGKHRWGFEFKRTAAPKLTPSMRTALVALQLTNLRIIHAGSRMFPLADKITAIPLERILEEVKP